MKSGALSGPGHLRREQEPQETQTRTGPPSALCLSTWDSPCPAPGHGVPLLFSCPARLWGDASFAPPEGPRSPGLSSRRRPRESAPGAFRPGRPEFPPRAHVLVAARERGPRPGPGPGGCAANTPVAAASEPAHRLQERTELGCGRATVRAVRGHSRRRDWCWGLSTQHGVSGTCRAPAFERRVPT